MERKHLAFNQEQNACFQVWTLANSQVRRTGIKVQVDNLTRSANLDGTQPLTVVFLVEPDKQAV